MERLFERVGSLLMAALLIGTMAGCAKEPEAVPTTQAELRETVPTASTTVGTEPSQSPEPTEPEVVPEPTETEPVETGPVETEPVEPEVLFEYRVLHDINPDLVGWMEIPGTVIDYPVVQSVYEPNFYLRRNFWKVGATCGTLYAREKCDVFLPADNITIYGHKMAAGTMFADLHKYKDPAFWEAHKYIRFDTIYEKHEYEIFAVFVSSADMSIGYAYHIFDVAKGAEDYDAHIQRLRDLALYDTGIVPQYGEKIITLSTCDKSIDQGRLVVVARMVETQV